MPDTMHRVAVTLRAEVTGNRLRGLASVFGQVADTPEGYEAFDRTAFDKLLADDGNDTVALWNHNPDHLLGRQSSGTLVMRSTDAGLEFDVDLPDTSIGRDLRELARRGDLRGGSIGYVPGDVRYDKAPDGRTITVHTSVARLRDVSPVTLPAYPGTNGSIALRAAEFGRPEPVRSQLIRARARVHLRGVK
ncbi:HK97 family phage prohead protease [Amycolatopsis sp. cmx-4-68]|uniref:HK97 family phage prohead protease n=1 Tax=Amycolatopsis sp. cmx-4-68 TaxID=2790938 RepID=UPI00397E30B3